MHYSSNHSHTGWCSFNRTQGQMPNVTQHVSLSWCSMCCICYSLYILIVKIISRIINNENVLIVVPQWQVFFSDLLQQRTFWSIRAGNALLHKLSSTISDGWRFYDKFKRGPLRDKMTVVREIRPHTHMQDSVVRSTISKRHVLIYTLHYLYFTVLCTIDKNQESSRQKAHCHIISSSLIFPLR